VILLFEFWFIQEINTWGLILFCIGPDYPPPPQVSVIFHPIVESLEKTAGPCYFNNQAPTPAIDI
jgi:hypothetical protein